MTSKSREMSAVDSVFDLRKILTHIEEGEAVEVEIWKELKEIEKCFPGEEVSSEGFYGDMMRHSVARGQKLLAYKLRTTTLIDRLSAFLRVNADLDIYD